MNYRIILAVLMLAFGISSADDMTQTDWSEGPGVYGPVFDWGSRFSTSDMINRAITGSLRLAREIFTDPIEHTVDGNFNGAGSVYTTDVDGDGDIDVLGTSFNGDEITWWENVDGSGTSWTKYTIDGDFNGAESVYAEDVDGDDDTDVLGAAANACEITWWENVDGFGTSWIEHTIDGYFNGAQSIYATDVDGDGDTDVLGAAYSDNDITWWENVDGSGISWIKRTVDGDFGGAFSVYATDVDGDGDIDVLGAAIQGDEITWWENVDGSGTSWTEHTVDVNIDAPQSVYATDVDGDGDVDVLGSAYYDDDIIWWENMDGSGTSWTEHTVDGDFDSAQSVFATDIDNDGDTDVLGAAPYDGDIIWWENVDGSGTAWIEHTVDGDFSGAQSVYAADVNGDGNIDVLGAASIDDDIIWWEVVAGGYCADGLLESSILEIPWPTDDLIEWGEITWQGSEPAATEISFQVRASDDPGNMGSWSDTISVSGTSLAGFLSEYDNYFQYRSILQTTDTDSTPVLNDITISWDILQGIGDNPVVSKFALHGSLVNPAVDGSVTIGFAIPEQNVVELNIFDLSGRLVFGAASEEFSAGEYAITVSDLRPGVYFIHMRAGEFSARENMVVLD